MKDMPTMRIKISFNTSDISTAWFAPNEDGDEHSSTGSQRQDNGREHQVLPRALQSGSFVVRALYIVLIHKIIFNLIISLFFEFVYFTFSIIRQNYNVHAPTELIFIQQKDFSPILAKCAIAALAERLEVI